MAVLPPPGPPSSSSSSSSTVTLSPLTKNLLVALVVLVALCLLSVGGLLILRSYRRRRFPSHNTSTSIPPRNSSRISHRRHGATNTTPKLSLPSPMMSEKEMLFDIEDREPQTPDSPVPEIRITFPDEDEQGVKREEKVMRVRMGEKGAVGLEPCSEKSTALPVYAKMETVDLDGIGGLKEKRGL